MAIVRGRYVRGKGRIKAQLRNFTYRLGGVGEGDMYQDLGVANE